MLPSFIIITIPRKECGEQEVGLTLTVAISMVGLMTTATSYHCTTRQKKEKNRRDYHASGDIAKAIFPFVNKRCHF